MFGNATWIMLVAPLVAIVWGLIQIGRHFDEEDDPKTKERRKQVGRWLSGQGGSPLENQLKETNQTFLYLFDRIFCAKQSVMGDIIWSGLLLSPIVLVGIRLPALVGAEFAFVDPADSLLFAILLAFSVSLGVAAKGRQIYFCFGGLLCGLGSILIVLNRSFGFDLIPVFLGLGLSLGWMLGIAFGVGNFFFALVNGLIIGLYFGSSGSVFLDLVGPDIGKALGLGSLGSLAIGFGIATLVFTFFLSILVYFTIIRGRASKFERSVHISVHPLRALASSLVFIIVVSLIGSLIRADAASTLLDTINREGMKVLSFIAFNIFGDAISLLETRWVLQRGSSATVVQLLGLLVLDLAASAAIFLFLPIVVGEIPTFWDAVLLHGDRPWLGILFWSTFGTSVLFYLFVTAVFLFLLPGNALAMGFRKVIGSFSTLEDRPFTSIAYALIALIFILLALTAGIAAAT
jgi:hypothetical protein